MEPNGHKLTWSAALKDLTPLIWGILNVTPDSFSDGGKFVEHESIQTQFQKLIDDGSDVIDVGAESTKLGSTEVSSQEELSRIEPVFTIIQNEEKPKLLSVDTRHSATAKVAIENGFHIINDISGGTFDMDMYSVMADSSSLVVLMHSRGIPENMNSYSNYQNLISEVCSELQVCIDNAITAGVEMSRIMIDPGIGFAKTPQQGLELIENIEKIKSHFELPLLVGISRKTIISYLMTGDPFRVPFEQRDAVSSEMGKFLIDHGVDAIRVHDVALTRRALRS